MKRIAMLATVQLLLWTQPVTIPASSQLYPGSPNDLQEMERSLAMNLTWNLENALILYYPVHRFVVRAHVELLREAPSLALPKLPEAYLKKDVKNLPGLPVLPDELRQAETSPAPPAAANAAEKMQAGGIRIRRVTVNVLVDRELPKDDFAFIRRLTTIIADLDPRRGDQIRLEPLAFPQASMEKEAPPAEQAQTPPAAQPAKRPAEPPMQQAWGPYWFAAATAFLLIGLFLLGMRMILTALRPAAGGEETASGAPAKAVAQGAPEPQALRQAQQEAQLAQHKAAVTETIVGAPGAAARLLRQWAAGDGDAGKDRAAQLLAAATPALLDLMAPFLGAELTADIRQKIDAAGSSAGGSAGEQAMNRFMEDFRRMSLSAQREEAPEDALAFLQQMTDDQILHLIRPLKMGVKAIVLAQLRAERTARLLKALPPEEKAQILSSMAGINRIASDVYQNIARQLAARARDLEKLRYVRADGVEALVEVLEHLDARTQEMALAHIETQDLQLARQVRARFMTFQEVLEMPEDELRQLALATEREVLTRSLVNVDEAAVQRILDALPDKLGEMVRADLEAHRQVPPAEVEEARRRILHTARQAKRGKTQPV